MRNIRTLSTYRILAPLVLGVICLPANPNRANAAEPPQIIERGPHHRVVERTITESLPDGGQIERKSSYVELATGMHYQDERGEWVESKEEIEIFEGGAVARQGPHQVIFSPNLNSPGAIDLLAPDGKRFRSHILGLVYTDMTTGNSVLLAETKDCVGAVLPPNQVIYRDAFVGDCQAHVRYTYTRAGFEQDIILITAPPSPAEFGLNPATTRLEVFTEFPEAPDAIKERRLLPSEVDAEFTDDNLDFGTLRIAAGKAFPTTPQQDPSDAASQVLVGKTWERITGRQFLIEGVQYATILKHIQALPKRSAMLPKNGEKQKRPEKRERLLAQVSQPPRDTSKQATMAMLQKQPTERGFVLDYQILNGMTNFTFRGDTTYYVKSTCVFYGTNIIEGGTVIKYTNWSTAHISQLRFLGPLECQTRPWLPAVFTSKDDNTVGETIAESTGAPSLAARAARVCIDLFYAGAFDLHDLYFKYARDTISADAGASLTGNNLQIGDCKWGILNYAATLRLRNSLMYNLELAFYGYNGSVRGEHLTLHNIITLQDGSTSFGTNTTYLTNSVLVGVTNSVFWIGSHVETNSTLAGVFQAAGGANFYLAPNSVYRNAGTTNIDPTLLATLRQRTTYPPVTLEGRLTSDTVLTPQAGRDTDVPDLGFHYTSADYAVGGLIITNSTLLLTNGVQLITYGTEGLWLQDGGRIISQGSPTNPCRILRYTQVQEQTTNWGNGTPGSLIAIKSSRYGVAASSACFRHTQMGVLSGGGQHFDARGASNIAELRFNDCELIGGSLAYGSSNSGDVLTLTNNLVQNLSLSSDYSGNRRFCNNLFRTTSLNLTRTNGTWLFLDNVFDNSTIAGTNDLSYSHTNNAYIGMTDRLQPSSPGDQILASMAYDTGPLGRFYQPTNSALLNVGSRNATNAGLYHFTTTTNQVKETNSTVDIGFHYVAVNSSGQPLDSDGDGLADYFEDANGNGSKDTGETGWLSALTDTDSDGDGVSDYVEYLLGRNPLVAGATNDVNGVINLRLYTPLK